MSEPIKVIFKVKNDNAKPQYYIYIYVGHVPEYIMKILDKIRELSLYDTLNVLSKTDIKELEIFYGAFWYTYFFNKHHISSTRKNILSNKQSLAEITKKYGEDWIKNNIKIQKSETTPMYTYGMLVHRNLVHHELRTKSQFEYAGAEQDNSYLVTGKQTLIMDNDTVQSGGDDANSEEEDYTMEDANDFSEEIPEDDDIDTEDLEKMYMTTETVTTKEVESTSSLIKKVMEDENILKKKELKMIKFDTSKDANIYKENIADVFVKNYVVEQYIFRDDAIKVIKNKICASIKNHPKYDKKCFIIPSRQYLWGEYFFNNNYEKIMIGTKWTQKNALLMVDVEPNENIKVYEELRDSIKNLKTDLKRFNSKIRKEDEENNILIDYDGYYDNNEIYMIDVYNELGKNYSPAPEALANVVDTYIKIYFPKIPVNEIKNIIDYLGTSPATEKERLELTHEIITADLLLENEIVNLVEKVKFKSKYTSILKENYVTQSMIHLLLRSNDTENFRRIDLFKIFDDMIPSEKYPFIQYMTTNGNVSFKFNEKEIEKYSQDKNIQSMITSWFQNVSYGISFKIRTDTAGSEHGKDNEYRFMTVNMNELGKLDYKIQWKEDDNALIEDIAKTYSVIQELIEELNKTSIKKKFAIPEKSEYKTAFITTIQRFALNDYTINHNDLSKFARYFYPYFALVIEPRKRVSKVHESELKSKFGTYLRYKRISKYENTTKIEQRIYYFIRNYEYTDQLIINEISKQFNITQEKAAEHLQKTLQKYSHIKKARKALKKFDISPKYKSPGIDIAIQGKTIDKYKIRISGARDKQQLQRIITTLNVLLYVYMETYLAKKPELQYLKEKLKKLNNIAERRHIVSDFVKYSDEKMNIKIMANADKRRIGYKPEKGQSHWTRVCQNSGTQQRRRPQQFTADNIDDMLKQGYAFNKATGMYERKIVTKKNGKTISQTVRAVKLNELDEAGNSIGNEIYYACSPEQNGIHMYVGFLTRSKNPHGEYMPCCFKKDQYVSSNSDKRNFFLKCIGKGDKSYDKSFTSFSDQLYILQDTNKIQQGRFGFLPNILDFYLNDMLKLKRSVVQHYLISAPSGYFFKYGINHGENSFVSAVANALDKNMQDVVNNVIAKLSDDRNNLLFTALNNGDIKTKFATKEKYIDYLKNISEVDTEYISHALSIPSVLTSNGLNIIVIMRVPNSMSNNATEKIKDNCHIICQNLEEVANIEDPAKETILLYKENNNYYPIFNVTKSSASSKDIIIQKTYTFAPKTNNIVNHIKDFYYKNCMERTIKSIVNKESMTTAKALCEKLQRNSATKQNDVHPNAQSNYLPKYQYIDVRNKCRYIITNNGVIIPVTPSGSIYNLQIINNLEKFHDTYRNTLDKIHKLQAVFNDELPLHVSGVNCDANTGTTECRSLILNTNEIIPITAEQIDTKLIIKDGLSIDTNPTYAKIDNALATPKKSIIDKRITHINYDKYFNESYELFRYTFSDYINARDNTAIRDKLIKIIASKQTSAEKSQKIKIIFYKLIDKELLDMFTSLTSDTDAEPDEMRNDVKVGGKLDKIISIIDVLPNLDNYTVKNIRTLCTTNNKDTCSNKHHCKWTHSGCLLALTNEMAIMFVNKITSELLDNEMKSKEILQLDDYFVSDIVNKNYYTERDNQKVIKSSHENVKKTIELFFKREKMNDNYRKSIYNQTTVDNTEVSKENPIKDYGKYYVQTIIPNNNSILRAYANCFHWNENQYQDKYIRNLGYYSEKQTDIMVYLKSLIIDWSQDKNNTETLDKLLMEYSDANSIYQFVTKLAANTTQTSNGIIELFILNKIHNVPIVIHENDMVVKVFDENIITKNLTKYEDLKNAINIQFIYSNETPMANKTPLSIDVIYYK